MNKITKEILKEFWFQFIISIIWAGYKINWEFATHDAILNAITNFATSFFLLSWFIGQFLRIKKQQKIESHFESITLDLKKLIEELQKSVNKIISNITGSESFAYVTIGNIHNDNTVGQVVILHSGEFPIYDATMEILNYNITSDKDYGRLRIFLGNLKQSRAHTSDEIPLIILDKNKTEHFNFTFSTRGGAFYTTIKMRFHQDKWIQAQRTVSLTDNKVLKINIPANYPNLSNDVELLRWQKESEQNII